LNLFKILANKFGYELINRKKYHHFDVATHLAYLLKKLEINLVLDVGANVGQFGSELRRIGYQGWIFSFEPVKQAYSGLFAQAKNDELWKTFNFALGSTEETLGINVTTATNLSSFFIPNDKAHESYQSQAPVVEVQNVDVHRLDKILPLIANNIHSPRILLKMDTQGFDIEVMKGAFGCLNDIMAVQSELSVLPLYENMPNYLEALSLYKEYGFEVTGVYPISRDKENLAVMEFDGFLVRKT
jgi:FkbM family methyltransferase